MPLSGTLIAKGGIGDGVTVEVGVGMGVGVFVLVGSAGNVCVGVVTGCMTVGINGRGPQLDNTNIARMLSMKPIPIKNRNAADKTAFNRVILLKLKEMRV